MSGTHADGANDRCRSGLCLRRCRMSTLMRFVRICAAPTPARQMTLGVLWVLALVGGMGAMMRYEYEAGARERTPVAWPEASPVKPTPDRPTLVLFAHPRCPCTLATLGELARVVARSGDRIRADVLVFKPTTFAD